MIEIEKKFALRPGDRERLIAGATFVATKKISDTYYDTTDFALTKKDWWLRFRNDRFELKMVIAGVGSVRQRSIDQYCEFETDQEIQQALGLVGNEPLRILLEKNGYTPFTTIITTREKYTKGGFVIDLDVMDFGYEVIEIELLVDAPEQVAEAEKKIMAFAASVGLSTDFIFGKVVEYLRRYRPAQFQVMVDVGLV